MELERLLELERRYWTGGAEVYRSGLAEEALLVFADPVGVLDRSATVASLEGAPRWESVELTEARVLWLTPEAVLLNYRARARRDGVSGEYEARSSSVYVRRDGEWRLAFHQQSEGS